MYQLLVIDDEQYALEGIMKAIDWNSLGIANVYGSECVEDAKVIVLNHIPEIIVCDIEMAQENGIDFLKWLSNGGFSTRLIFLTAHANFKYAQEAIRFGAFEYLLKPVKHDVLKEVVKKALKDFEVEMSLHDKLHEYEEISKNWELSGAWDKVADGDTTDIFEKIEKTDTKEIVYDCDEISNENEPKNPLNEPELIRVVKQYIHENLGEVTRESIAEAVSVNASYLSRVYHKATGEKLSAYILRKRIRFAKQLLRDTDDKISYIANAVGYLNDSYFIKVFRNMTAMTPYEYRKRHRNEKN